MTFFFFVSLHTWKSVGVANVVQNVKINDNTWHRKKKQSWYCRFYRLGVTLKVSWIASIFPRLLFIIITLVFIRNENVLLFKNVQSNSGTLMILYLEVSDDMAMLSNNGPLGEIMKSRHCCYIDASILFWEWRGLYHFRFIYILSVVVCIVCAVYYLNCNIYYYCGLIV